MSSEHVCEVVIVGGGIAGSALAAVLAQAGRDVVLLEKSETFTDVVRGEYIVPWGVKEAQRLGLLDALIAAGGHYLIKALGYDELRTPEAEESAVTNLARFVPGITGSLAIGHPQHCHALLDRAAAAGAEVRRAMSALLTVEAGAVPKVSFEADGRQFSVRARLIVGTDGRASAVRANLSIPLTVGPPRTMLSGMLIEGVDGWDEDSCALGTENDLFFAIFPQDRGRARLYACWELANRHRFAGTDGADAFLAGFALQCCPKSRAITSAGAAGPLGTFLNNETIAEVPFVEGAVLIGDAGGWTDPISACGLSSAYRDARIVSDILLASDDWSAKAFAPYADERNERIRRLKFITDIETALTCRFDELGRARRLQFFERLPSDSKLASHFIANMAGPEVLPPGAYTSAHRAHVLGEV
jgi:2-polyprenyl-6-methoxyphenol hydroxylase-like FAD-dependent oxidoreductase